MILEAGSSPLFYFCLFLDGLVVLLYSIVPPAEKKWGLVKDDTFRSGLFAKSIFLVVVRSFSLA
jgi:hypothetical protein